jgi:aminoglycoside phosphotransferase family enzyme
MSQLPELVTALLDPKIYPESPTAVELVQTQMSFVFLTHGYVYKMKKPVNLGYLDYTSLEKRRLFCHKEIELNSRLCDGVYLKVAPIVQSDRGISVGGQGEVIEYAVKMRRLPQERMMDVLLENNQVSADMIARVAQKLAAFHAQAETDADISAFGNLDVITTNTEENFAQTARYLDTTISKRQYQHITDYTRGFIENNAALFRKRVSEGRIKDCHGDLHAAHICFSDGICIYDCIEFNDRFRYCDIASEIGFLAMDLDHYRRTDLSHQFVNAYVDRSQDRELLSLLDFYKCYRAYVRGKVESFKLDDLYVSPEEKASILATAKNYFELAEAYTMTNPLVEQ